MRRMMMMKWNTNNVVILLITLLCVPIIIVHGFNDDGDGEEGGGLSLELVHRHDSRLKVDDDVDQLEVIKGFIHRDSLRRQRMNQRLGLGTHVYDRRKNLENRLLPELPMHSGRDYGLGEYFVKVMVGTPRHSFWLAADTGSEFTWFNSREIHHNDKNHNNSVPHNNINNRHGGDGSDGDDDDDNNDGSGRGGRGGGRGRKARNGTRTRRGTISNVNNNDPCIGVFCPHLSRSFKPVTCSSRQCKVDLSDLFSLTICPKPSDPCQYDISYADGSSAKGFFGTEMITLDRRRGRKGKVHNLTIGCTTSIENGVSFNKKTGGILGLGYAKESFIDKAARQYGARFSYCLVDHLAHRSVSSFLNIGGSHNKAKLMSEIKRTELVLMPPFYGVKVVGMSIGGQMLKIPPNVWDFSTQGGTIVDSGTTLTGLILPAYEPVFEALKKSLTKAKKVDEDFGVLEFCFSDEGFDESVVPRLVFHFAGGARFEPPVKSYIIDVAPQVKCIGIVPIRGTIGASVIGNIMQQNHLWEFDLSKNTIGFSASTCTK